MSKIKFIAPLNSARLYFLTVLFVSFFASSLKTSAQSEDLIYDNYNYRESIKTAMIHPTGMVLGDPFIRLEGSVNLTVRFDDMDGDYKDLYYTVYHCDSDWNLSDLDQVDYLEGFYSNPIDDFEQSFNTLVSYTHYTFQFPNDLSRIRFSGNYLLVVYENDDPDNLVLSKRFVVYEEQVIILPQVKEPTKVLDTRYKQEVDVQVQHENFDIVDPYDNFSITILQNGRWDNAKYNLPPRFVKNNILDFNYGDENVFDGANEWREFDIKDMDYISPQVEVNGIIDRQWHSWLRPDPSRAFKIYRTVNDLNGKFFIRNDDAFDPNLEEEYVWVHFKLPFEMNLHDNQLFVFGALTNYRYNETNRLKYNAETKNYELSLQLKQGFYNYMYLSKFENEESGSPETTEGNHFATENDYHVFAYYYDFFENYDRVVGYVLTNSY